MSHVIDFRINETGKKNLSIDSRSIGRPLFGDLVNRSFGQFDDHEADSGLHEMQLDLAFGHL